MNKPDHITQEIWDAATECADVVQHSYWPGVKVIAQAIATERERCASIAEATMFVSGGTFRGPSPETIAAAIRGPLWSVAKSPVKKGA